jgi:hypothetical protein
MPISSLELILHLHNQFDCNLILSTPISSLEFILHLHNHFNCNLIPSTLHIFCHLIVSRKQITYISTYLLSSDSQ